VVEQKTREAKYSQLGPERLIQLLDKYKDVGVFGTLPPNVPKIKRKTVDGVIKHLKEQIR